MRVLRYQFSCRVMWFHWLFSTAALAPRPAAAHVLASISFLPCLWLQSTILISWPMTWALLEIWIQSCPWEYLWQICSVLSISSIVGIVHTGLVCSSPFCLSPLVQRTAAHWCLLWKSPRTVCTGIRSQQASSVGLLAVKSQRCFVKACRWPHECYHTLCLQV